MADFDLGDGTLVIKGELTVEHAVAFRDALMEAIEGPDGVTLDMSRVKEVDLACLQLLCSSLKTAGSHKRNIYFSGSSDALTEAVRYLGTCNDKGCTHKDAGCFITHGG